MKTTVVSIALAAAIAAGTVGISAASSAFSGVWKIDYAKSKLVGDTFTFSTLPGGKMKFSDGANDSYVFACDDGKAYSTLSNSTITCAKVGPRAYRFTYATAGKTTGIETDTIAPDGASFSGVEHQVFAGGKTRTVRTRYTRVGTGAGLAGNWKSSQTSSSSPAVFALVATPTTVAYQSKLSGSAVTIKLDGSKSSLTGPGVPAGYYIVAKPAGPSQVDFTQILAGKDVGESTWVLSRDGKTLEWTSWTPGKKSEATLAVYQKQ